MKTAVVICEFNPLHYGHKRIIDFAKSTADFVVCVMSGNFVERGMPAVANKYKRASHAIAAGADLVVELPAVYATSSAENFAFGGVSLANALGADYLVFGSECGDLSQLCQVAEMLDDPQTNAQIRAELQKGVSYPRAVATACKSDVLDKPNNTLAVEYLRALKRTQSQLQPLTILREDNYNGAPQQYASSTALREHPDLREKFTYDFVAADVDDTVEAKYGEFATRFLATAEKSYLESIDGVTEGLHNRIFAADKTQGYENLMQQLKTKRYTRLKLQRIVLAAVLGITKDVAKAAKTPPKQAKVLAVRQNATQLLANPALTTETDELTSRADRLYATFDGETPPTKLLKLQ